MNRFVNSIKRVGAVPQKFQFSLVVSEISLSKPLREIFPTSHSNLGIQFLWRRGPRSAASPIIDATLFSNSLSIDGWKSDPPLTLMCTLYQQEGRKSIYLEKNSTITIRIVDKKSKQVVFVLGAASLNLGKYGTSNEMDVQDNVILSKSKDPKAKISYILKTKWLKEINAEEDGLSVSILERDLSYNEDMGFESRVDPKDASSSGISYDKSALMPNSHSKIPNNSQVSKLIAERDEVLKQKKEVEKKLIESLNTLAVKEEELKLANDLKEQRDFAVSELSQLKAELKILRSKACEDNESRVEAADSQKKKYSQAIQDLMVMEDKMTRAMEMMDKKDDLIDELRAEINRGLEREKNLQDEIEKYRAEIRNVQDNFSSLSASSGDVSHLKSQVAKLTEELNEQERRRSSIEVKKSEMKRKISVLERELEESQQQVGQMEVKMVTLKCQLVDTVDQLNTMEVEKMRLNRQLQTMSAQGSSWLFGKGSSSNFKV